MWIRTTLVRLGLGLALAVAMALAFVAARALEPAKASFLPKGTSAVVVLDVSLSVTDPVFRRIHNTLQMLGNGGQGMGVVAFSDVAYEMLPPGSPPEEVKPMLRYFRGRPCRIRSSGATSSTPLNPWGGGFSAGHEDLRRAGDGGEGARGGEDRERLDRPRLRPRHRAERRVGALVDRREHRVEGDRAPRRAAARERPGPRRTSSGSSARRTSSRRRSSRRRTARSPTRRSSARTRRRSRCSAGSCSSCSR